jgi:predicted HicB family RNase H-like nuclease
MVEKRLKTATLNLRIVPELKRAAEQAADADNRSVTSLIEKLLIDYLKTHDYLPVPRPGVRFRGGKGKR